MFIFGPSHHHQTALSSGATAPQLDNNNLSVTSLNILQTTGSFKVVICGDKSWCF